MNNLVQLIIRRLIKGWAYHTDIRKMYNAVLLDKSFWRFQLYLWENKLSSDEDPKSKVIKTCHVDDCISGEATEEEMANATDELRLCLEKGGGIYFEGVYLFRARS